MSQAKKCHRRKNVTGEIPSTESNDADEREEALIKFDPPLYKQRYKAVADLLRTHQIVSVVEFGIAEGNVLLHYKGLETLQHIIGVDIEEELLVKNRHKINPLTSDYLMPRKNPLKIELLCGSLADYDVRTGQCEAVCMIEVIEHLYDDVLDQLPSNIFGRIRPRLVVLTTPNSEFNVLFPDFSGFRHPDHKFEWTRSEFQQWCSTQAAQYGYTVSFSGVGEPPPASHHVGQCSQIAVFIRDEDMSQCEAGALLDTRVDERDEMPYKLVASAEHPCTGDVSEDTRLVNEAYYYIHRLAREYTLALQRGEIECLNWREESRLEISLDQLLAFPQLASICTDRNRLRSLLEKSGLTFAEEDDVIIYNIEDSDDDSDVSSEHSFTDDVTDGIDTNNGDMWEFDAKTVTHAEQNETENADWNEGENTGKFAISADDNCWSDIEDTPTFKQYFLDSNGKSPKTCSMNGEESKDSGRFSDAEDDKTTNKYLYSKDQVVYNLEKMNIGSQNIIENGNIAKQQYCDNTQECLGSKPESANAISNSNQSSPKIIKYNFDDALPLGINGMISAYNPQETNKDVILAKLERPLIKCEGCGCEITRLGNSGYLCGLSPQCRASFTKKFKMAAELRAKLSLYRETVAGQFIDA